MNRRVLPLLIGLLLLPLGCGGDDPTGPPLVLQPSDLCSQQPDDAIATFEDATLEAAIRAALSVGATCGLVSGLTALAAEQAGITSLVGIQNLTRLTSLFLSFNSITDISLLALKPPSPPAASIGRRLRLMKRTHLLLVTVLFVKHQRTNSSVSTKASEHGSVVPPPPEDEFLS